MEVPLITTDCGQGKVGAALPCHVETIDLRAGYGRSLAMSFDVAYQCRRPKSSMKRIQGVDARTDIFVRWLEKSVMAKPNGEVEVR